MICRLPLFPSFKPAILSIDAIFLHLAGSGLIKRYLSTYKSGWLNLFKRMSRKIGNLWIIDDDPMASFYIKRLAELGELANIITIYDKARGAVDNLEYHRQTPEHLPDVILLDIYMPDMDGWAFLENFALVKPDLGKLPDIFIISSSGHLKDINRARSLSEVKAFLQKPVTMDVLKNLVLVAEKNS